MRSRRKNIYETLEQQGFLCHWCRSALKHNDVTRDHIIPKSKGGTSNPKNICASCMRCNVSKGCRSAEDFVELLKSSPKPHIKARIRKSKKRHLVTAIEIKVFTKLTEAAITYKINVRIEEAIKKIQNWEYKETT